MSVLKFREPQTNEWKEITTIVGPAGKDGAPGADGKDYILTEEDKAEIAAMVDVGGGGSGSSSENCVFISAQPWLIYDEVPENEFAVAFWRELNDNGKIKTDTEVYFTDTSGNKFRVIDYQTESTGFYIKTAFNKDNIRYVRYYNMGDASSTAISVKGSVYTETAAASGKSWTYYSASATANCLIPEVSSPFMKIVGYWDSNTTNYVNYEIYHQNDGSLGNNNNTFKHYIYDPIKSKAYYFGYHLWMSPASYGISLYELDGTQVMGSQFHVVGYYLYS